MGSRDLGFFAQGLDAFRKSFLEARGVQRDVKTQNTKEELLKLQQAQEARETQFTQDVAARKQGLEPLQAGGVQAATLGEQQFQQVEKTPEQKLKERKLTLDIAKVAQDIEASKSLVKKRGVETISPQNKAKIDQAKRLISDQFDLTDGFINITEDDKPILENAFRAIGLAATIEEIKADPSIMNKFLRVLTPKALEKPLGLAPPKAFRLEKTENIKDATRLSDEELLRLLGTNQAAGQRQTQ